MELRDHNEKGVMRDYLTRSTVESPEIVKLWEEDIVLPTYEVGEEEKNPVFLEKRVYQGSSGVVYPYPVIEKIGEKKTEKLYKAFFIENCYIKVMILPELGGRIHMAFDKIRKVHFVYFNQVIKPALVGLTGPWISGGIEFNWPQHHRPGTFLPVDCTFEEFIDGSKTVWCSEIERMSRMKGMHGVTLYPGKAYIEIKGRVYNRTPFPQTFLWWANPAVAVDKHYKSVFPPDVNAVYDHGKRDVSSFPIAKGVYYKQDYSNGVDISRYENIPVPTSFMAVSSEYDFVGGYNEKSGCGLLHVANHHISPGKKQWSWGNGDFGKAWERNLTDEDGPYIELMTGVYTDNQPDFSWLQPYEEKSWNQFFMPYTEVGAVKNASKDLIVNLEAGEGSALIIVYATSEIKGCKIIVQKRVGYTLFREQADISPEKPFNRTIRIPIKAHDELTLTLKSSDGYTLLSCSTVKGKNEPTPSAAEGAPPPTEVPLIEQLYLTGLHLEQYRHATFNPLDYYREALTRDAGDIRSNNGIGLLLMRSGQYLKALPYFEKAIKTLTTRNPNPYDGEPYYNLGCCLKFMSAYEKAYNAFFKSAWNAAWKDPAYFSLAQIDCIRDNFATALENIEQSLIRNWHNHKARQLKASILRRLGRMKEAERWIEASLEIDRFNTGALYEQYLLTNSRETKRELTFLLQNNPHTLIEYVLDFTAAGLFEEGLKLLKLAVEPEGPAYPMIGYLWGYLLYLLNQSEEGDKMYEKAFLLRPDKCFPNRPEEATILQHVLSVNPNDSKAFFYLGNFWYARRQYEEAIACWEKSVALNDFFPTALRNLSLAYYNKADKKTEAKQLLEKAFSLDQNDARLLMELDQLSKKLNYPPAERLKKLEEHLLLVEERDDLYIERVALCNLLGRFEEAMLLLSQHHFHPWEGGEGKVIFQFTLCRMELAKEAIRKGDFGRALLLLDETDSYPPNLGEGKLSTVKENDIAYFKGICYRGLRDENNATEWLFKATEGPDEPQQAFYYNDENPDRIYFQGLAWKAMGDEDKAKERFRKLITHGEQHLYDDCTIDYFAVSLPDLAIWEEDLNKRNRIHCYFVMALGWKGLGETDKAADLIEKILALDVNHQGIMTIKN